MSNSNKERLARAPRWLWLTLGGTAAVVIVVVAVVALRLPAEPTAQAAAMPTGIQDREPTSVEHDEDSSLVTYPREPGIVLDREGEQSAEQSLTSTPASTPEEPPPTAAAPLESSTEAVAQFPPKPDSTTSVRLLASTKPATATQPTNDSDDKQRPPPDKPPRIEADPLPESPRGPDPTYATAKTSAKAETQTSFEKLIREMLEQSWTAKATGLKQAEDKFKTASELCPDDPRAHYAYGLVLLKHNQYDEAIKRFDAAGEAAKPPYLPAIRAALWLRVLRKAYEPATLDLVNLTRAWQKSEPQPLPDWVQSDFVIWTGRMMGYLDGPADNRSVDALVEKCTAEIGTLLSKEHWELFKTAKMDVLDSYSAKAGAQEQARMQAKRQKEKEADETKAHLAEESAQTKQDKKQVEKSAEELEKALKEQLGATDSQLNFLAREYDRLDSRARYLSNSVKSLDQEIANLSSQRTQLQSEQNSPPAAGTGKTGSSKTPPSSNNSALIVSIGVTIDQKNRERFRYQAEYDRLEIQARDIQRQGVTLANKRQTLINDYQTTTGKLYKEKESLTAKEKFLERKQQEASKPASGRTTQVKVLGQTAKALRTYVDLNLEFEKHRLLESFAKP